MSLSLSSAAALLLLTLNAAKSSIPFGSIKCHPKAWWSAEVKEAVSERRKAFAAAHKSHEVMAYISASRRALSVIAKAKAEAWQATCSSLSRPNLTLNLCTLSFALSLALLPHHLPPLLTSQTVPLPESQLRSMPIT